MESKGHSIKRPPFGENRQAAINDDINDGEKRHQQSLSKRVIYSLEVSNSNENFSRENERNNDASNGNKYFPLIIQSKELLTWRKCKRIIVKGILKIGKNCNVQRKGYYPILPH